MQNTHPAAACAPAQVLHSFSVVRTLQTGQAWPPGFVQSTGIII